MLMGSVDKFSIQKNELIVVGGNASDISEGATSLAPFALLDSVVYSYARSSLLSPTFTIMSSLLRLCDLYGGVGNTIATNPSIKLADRTITSLDINEAFVKLLPEFATTNKTWILDRDDALTRDFNFIVTGVQQCSAKIPPIKAAFTQVVAYDHVKFFNHDTARKFVPRMLINVQNREIIPGHCVFINTGYTIKTASSCQQQVDFILLPNIVCKDATGKNCKIIPNIYARDEDDCGLFTVSFTLIEGVPAKIQVVFNCYLVGKIADNCVELHAREPNNEIFKPKDMREGRATKNLKIKTHFESMDRKGDYVEFKTYNHLVSPPITWPNQTLRVHKKIAVITSRRREWSQEPLITVSGVCVDAKNDRKPIVFTRDNMIPSKNTHCVTIIDSKATLHSHVADVNNYHGLSLINGAFTSCLGSDFAKIQKRIKVMNDHANKLDIHRRIVARMCGENDVDSIKTRNMWNVYDAAQSLDAITLDDPKLTTSLMTEEELFKALTLKITKETTTISSALMYSMYWLTATFLTSELSSESLAELSAKVSVNTTAKKNKHEKTDESCAAKKPKLV